MMQKLFFFFILLSMAWDSHSQDLKLWYDKPAQEWVEALPIGNGRLGAMVFGGVSNDRVQFNEETLWTGYPREYNKKGAYQYLDSIRNLLFAGKQKAAEDLAGREFLGLMSADGNKEKWLQKILSVLKLKSNPSKMDFNDKSWKSISVPNYDGWETEGLKGVDGAVWFRYSFEVPEAYLNKELILDLNKIYNQDFTFINGVPIGQQDDDKERIYSIPNNLLRKGKNTIAILVVNYSGKGGLLGFKDTNKQIGFKLSSKSNVVLPVNGVWKYAIQDQDTPAVGQFQASYQPFGDLYIHTNLNESQANDYKRTLDLATATLTTTYSYNEVQYKKTYVASQPDQVLAIHYSANKPGAVFFEASLRSPHRNFVVKQINKNTIAIKVKVKDGALFGECYLQVKLNGGQVLVKNNKLIVQNANEATLLVSAATNYKNHNDITGKPGLICATTLQKLDTKNFDAIHQDHIKEYQQYFNTLTVGFGDKSKSLTTIESLPTDQRLNHFVEGKDPQFVALYMQYGRYLLISSSRPGTYPANLQGIWNDLLSPPWGSKYTTNINIQMNYWPAEVLNLSPLHSSLFKMIEELSESGKETAREYYNAPGWVLHHNTDLWRGTAPINASNHGIWVTGGAWFCDHLWERYQFTKNENFLKDTAYPIMKSASEFFNSFLIKDPETGYLISTPSNSPEQGGLVAGPTMDHQIIRTLFKNTIEAASILKKDLAFADLLKEKYAQIAPNKIGQFGQLQEWMQDVDDTANKHRHVSHLWAVYPGNEINWEHIPELMKAARQSLIYRGDAATGWSLGWKINLWARFKDGNHTYKLIQMLLSPAGKGAGSYPNLFDAHPPFQIDGNFGGTAGIGEMLVQSQSGFIDLLPALPNALPEGFIKGIKARGGFELDFSWRNKQLQALTVRSVAGGKLNLKYKDKNISMPTDRNGVYIFNDQLTLQ